DAEDLGDADRPVAADRDPRPRVQVVDPDLSVREPDPPGAEKPREYDAPQERRARPERGAPVAKEIFVGHRVAEDLEVRRPFRDPREESDVEPARAGSGRDRNAFSVDLSPAHRDERR